MLIIVTLVSLSDLSLVACKPSIETRENTFSVGSIPEVKIDIGSGDVDLVLGNTDEIRVVAELQKPENVERTACHGFCPVYTLSIQGDGTVVYEGENIVETRGRAEITITKEKVLQLVSEFEKIGFFSLNDNYTECTITDAPSAITSITVDGKTKNIEHYHGDFSAPETLTELEDKIDEMVNSVQWIK